jgi:hypothetical protein
MSRVNINDKYINELPDNCIKAYLHYKEGKFVTEHYGSHLPVLIHTVNTITEGNVIEFGTGLYSTPVLHLLCEKLGRKLFSFEFNSEYYEINKSFENDNHKIFLLDEIMFRNNEYLFTQDKYAIALIDSSPSWTRQVAINCLKDSVDYFIVHDVAKILKNGTIIPMNTKLYNFNYFKTVLMFKKIDRATILCTNKEIPENLMEIFK